MFTPLHEALPPASAEPKLEKTKKAKARMALEESESSADEDEAPKAAPPPAAQPPPPPPQERLSESPVQISPHGSNPPALVGDSSSHSEGRHSPASPETSSLELVEKPQEDAADTPSVRDRGATPASTAQSASRRRGLSYTKLSRWMDSNQDIKDLLWIVHDTTDAKPLPDHHPFQKAIDEDLRRLDAIGKKLDRMLLGLLDQLARKAEARRGTEASR
jgi:hypothetical protein